MAVLLAFMVGAGEALPWLVLPQIADSALGGALVFILLYYMLVRMPLNAMRGGGPGGGGVTRAARSARDSATAAGSGGTQATGAAPADVAGAASDAAGAPVDVGRAAFADAAAFWNSRPAPPPGMAGAGRRALRRSAPQVRREPYRPVARREARRPLLPHPSRRRRDLHLEGVRRRDAADGKSPAGCGERSASASSRPEERLARFVQSMLRSRMIDV